MARQSTGYEAGIVATVAAPAAQVETFARYHLGVGFDRIYLFVDSADDGLLALGDIDGVEVFPRDDALRQQWTHSRTIPNGDPRQRFIDDEIVLRQVLNAEIALRRALGEGLGWLLHIDADELFAPADMELKPHLQLLDRSYVDRVKYLNIEALAPLPSPSDRSGPSDPSTPSVSSPFTEVTSFKVNPAMVVIDNARKPLTQEVGEDFYHSYGNGKSMVRVSDDVFPGGPHNFYFADELDGLADSWYRDSVRRSVVLADPVVLHYPCCGLDAFVEKFGRPDPSMSDEYTGAEVGRFRRRAFELCAAGDPSRIEAFYRDRVCLDRGDLVDRLRQAELIVEVDMAKRFIENGFSS